MGSLVPHRLPETGLPSGCPPESGGNLDINGGDSRGGMRFVPKRSAQKTATSEGTAAAIAPARPAPDKAAMEFLMTGYKQQGGVRRYTFKGTTPETTSLEFAVETEIALLPRYGIGIQELPLMCRRLLEKDGPRDAGTVLVFTEELMREHAEHIASVRRAALDKRKPHRRPPAHRLGQHWRGPAQ